MALNTQPSFHDIYERTVNARDVFHFLILFFCSVPFFFFIGISWVLLVVCRALSEAGRT